MNVIIFFSPYFFFSPYIFKSHFSPDSWQCLNPSTRKQRNSFLFKYIDSIYSILFPISQVDEWYAQIWYCFWNIYRIIESESEISSIVSNSLRPHGLYRLWNCPGQNIGVGSLSLLRGIIPTRMINCIKSVLGNGGGFPGGSEVKNLPCNARDWLDPWSSKILHAAGHLSPCTTAAEPAF